jgi:hypothetical protein
VCSSDLDEIYKDPSLPSVTGMIQGRLPALSQDGTDLVVKIDQLKGKAFLQAFETLKGGGQITEREGLAATKAIARLERQQGPEAYREYLKALRSVVERVRKRALGQEVPEYSDEEFEAIIGNLPAILVDTSVCTCPRPLEPIGLQNYTSLLETSRRTVAHGAPTSFLWNDFLGFSSVCFLCLGEGSWWTSF